MLEAVALGVPVASMDCPSGPREILSDGRGGKLVPANDYRALGEAIAELLRSPEAARRLAEQATRDAVRFQPSHVGERYEAIIERVCGTA
jgi:glycosyltransferase involved in cell wall biosynthesis